MQQSLRVLKSTSTTSIPEKMRHASSSSSPSQSIAEVSGTRSLTKKISRSFTTRKVSKESTTSSASSDSGSVVHISPPTTPGANTSSSYFLSAKLSPNGSQSSGSRRNSTASTYDIGYGSGRYAVNLEDIYAQEAQTSTAVVDDDDLRTKGLQKFSAQDYLSLL